jgi:hypothetical protein
MRFQRSLAAAIVAAGMALSSAAWADKDVTEVPLKDGATLLIFKDGKMSMRDSRGRVHSMKEGVTMETKDGQVIVMRGNEIWRKTTAEKLREELYRGG